MQSKKVEGAPDERITRKAHQTTRMEQLWEQIVQKQLEIRSLEIELARTDPNELAKESDTQVSS
jgi:hypothetical protein